VLAIPGAAALAVLLRLRRAVPQPARYEHGEDGPPPPAAGAGPLPARLWLYAGFTALTVLGYATFAVLAYHLQVRHVVSEGLIPVVYAAAMGVDAVAALASGWLYDRIGLRGLVVVPVLTAAVPFLSFSDAPGMIWAGAAVWGAAMGVHDSTMRAAVADLVPARRRGVGYGTFTAIYGLAWLAGAAAIGALYGASIGSAQLYVVVTQAVALAAFVPLVWRVR
jgi:hypothetical protein